MILWRDVNLIPMTTLEDRAKLNTALIDDARVAIRHLYEGAIPTHSQLAAYLGVNPNTVARWRGGDTIHPVYEDRLRKIATGDDQ